VINLFVQWSGIRPGNWCTNSDAEGTHSWFEDGCYPSEPVFVPTPDTQAEDDGVILNVVLDTRAGTSFMLALHAGDLTEIARAELPHHLPFNFHPQYYS
jgi:carotenoid cleavage dioxygenase-like enzyme